MSQAISIANTNSDHSVIADIADSFLEIGDSEKAIRLAILIKGGAFRFKGWILCKIASRLAETTEVSQQSKIANTIMSSIKTAS